MPDFERLRHNPRDTRRTAVSPGEIETYKPHLPLFYRLRLVLVGWLPENPGAAGAVATLFSAAILPALHEVQAADANAASNFVILPPEAAGPDSQTPQLTETLLNQERIPNAFTLLTLNTVELTEDEKGLLDSLTPPGLENETGYALRLPFAVRGDDDTFDTTALNDLVSRFAADTPARQTLLDIQDFLARYDAQDGPYQLFIAVRELPDTVQVAFAVETGATQIGGLDFASGSMIFLSEDNSPHWMMPGSSAFDSLAIMPLSEIRDYLGNYPNITLPAEDGFVLVGVDEHQHVTYVTALEGGVPLEPLAALSITGRVNVREFPGTDQEIVGTLSAGSEIRPASFDAAQTRLEALGTPDADDTLDRLVQDREHNTAFVQSNGYNWYPYLDDQNRLVWVADVVSVSLEAGATPEAPPAFSDPQEVTYTQETVGEPDQAEEAASSTELVTALPEELENTIETEFRFATDDIEQGLDIGVGQYGVYVISTVGNTEYRGAPGPTETTSDFLLHVRADMAVRAAQREGISLTYEEAIHTLESGESFGFTSTVRAIPAGALRAVSSGSGGLTDVPFNPDLPENGGTKVVFLKMRAGFYMDMEDQWPDRLQSFRGLSSGTVVGRQYAILSLSNGTVLIVDYGGASPDQIKDDPAVRAADTQGFAGQVNGMFSELPLSETEIRTDFDYHNSDDMRALQWYGVWIGLPANGTAEDYAPETSIPWATPTAPSP